MAKEKNTIISDKLTITPNNINRKHGFWESFGNIESESSASWIVKLCQKNNGWKPFTLKDIEELYS